MVTLAIMTLICIPVSDPAYADIFYHLILSGMVHLAVRSLKGGRADDHEIGLLVVYFATQNYARDVPSPHALAVTAQQ